MALRTRFDRNKKLALGPLEFLTSWSSLAVARKMYAFKTAVNCAGGKESTKTRRQRGRVPGSAAGLVRDGNGQGDGQYAHGAGVVRRLDLNGAKIDGVVGVGREGQRRAGRRGRLGHWRGGWA